MYESKWHRERVFWCECWPETGMCDVSLAVNVYMDGVVKEVYIRTHGRGVKVGLNGCQVDCFSLMMPL